MEVTESLKSMNITPRVRPTIEGIIDHPGIQFLEPSYYFKAPVIDLRPESESKFEVSQKNKRTKNKKKEKKEQKI